MTRVGRGSKNPKFGVMSFMDGPLQIKKDSWLCRSMFILCRSIFCLGKVQGKNVRLHLSKKYESSSDEKRMVTEIDIF